MTIKDFEVAGIHFNGATNVDIQDCEIGPSLQMTYQAFLSQSNFIDHLMNSLLPMTPDINVHRNSATVTIKGVEHIVNDVFKTLHDILHTFYETGGGGMMDVFRDADRVDPDEPKGLPDGSAVYGIVIHKTGPAAGDFATCELETAQAGGLMLANTVIKNVQITDLAVDVRQITRLILDGKQCMGPAGDVFDIERTFSSDDHYSGTALSDAQLAVGAFLKYLRTLTDEDGNQQIPEDQLLYFFGATHIPDTVLTWAASEAGVAWEGGEFSCMGDSMSHVNKGAIGLFLNHLEGSDIENVAISNIANSGQVDAEASKCVQADYKGADARGICLVNCVNVELGDTVTVAGVTSEHGAALETDTMTT
jgi:hypothetical protein